MGDSTGMLSVLALAALFATDGLSPAATPSAAPAPLSTPFTTVTPAPLRGATVLATPSPTPTATPTPIFNVFDGVMLGEASATVRKNLGKPFEIDPVNVGEMWQFNADRGNARLSVVFANGAALSITLTANGKKKTTFADPYGVALGMTVDQLTAMRGQPVTVSDNGNRAYGDLAAVRWVYGVDSGQITDINVSQPVTPTSPAAPSALNLMDGHDGSSVDRAIIVTAASSAAGAELENRYIKGQTCGQAGSWYVAGQTTLAVGVKWFDEFDVTCSSDKSAQKLYFDVTSYAGK
jgi:hypothetical protein